MMKRLWLLLALLCATTAYAQVSVTGSSVRGAGTVLASGHFCVGATCFAVTNGVIAAGSSISAGTYTVSITNGSGVVYLTAPNISVSFALDWDTYTISTPFSGIGVPYLACTVSDTYQQTDTGTNWVCATLLGRSVWTVNNHSIPNSLHPGVYAGNGAPTFTCTSPCVYVQNDATSSSANFWDTQAYPGTPTTNWVQQKGAPGSNGPDVDISTYAGADACTKLSFADSTVSGPATFAIYQNMTCSTVSPLSAGHNLAVYANLAFSNGGYIVPTQDNRVDCYGDGLFTMNTPYTTPSVPDGTTPFFYSPYPASGSEIERFPVRNCTFQGYGALGAILDANGPTQDVTFDGNTTNYAWLYRQGGAPASNPTVRLKATKNKCIWPTNIGQGACILIYGAIQESSADLNYFSGYYGVEVYGQAADGTQAPSFPTMAEIQSSGISGLTFTGNVCASDTTACIWTSVADRITMTGNSADACNDVCFDVEGGAHHLFTGNHCNTVGNACVSSFFTSFQNSAIANQFDGCSGIHVFNSSQQPSYVQDWRFADNVFNCPSSASIWMYLDATQDTDVEGSKVLNGTQVFTTYQSNFRLVDNHLRWTIAAVNQAANGGSPQVGGSGLGLPNFNDTLGGYMIGNTVETSVTQTLPCLSAGTSNPNANLTTTIRQNTCLGTWGYGLVFANSGGNPSIANTLILRDNGFSAATNGYFQFNANSGSAAPIVQEFGNYDAVTGAAVQCENPMLFLLTFFMQAAPATTYTQTLSVVYPYSALRCTYAPASLPAPGTHTFSLTDGTTAVTAQGVVNPIAHGNESVTILYKPLSATICPTVNSIQ